MIINFIKSWFYYPKLKKYLKSIGVRDEDMYGTRLGYAKNHCHKRTRKDNKYKTENISDGWTSIYDREPIEERTVVK